MNPTAKRSLLYGAAAAALGAMFAAGSGPAPDADVSTLLSSADVQLRLAYSMPERDENGTPLTSRADMLSHAEGSLATVERLQPGMAVTAEFAGFAHMLRGRFAEAAASYAKARRCTDCQDEQRDVLAFNESRMLAKAGRHDEALAVLDAAGPALDARYPNQRALEAAAILRQASRTADAAARLEPVRTDAAATPMASLQAGVEYLHLGLLAPAETMLGRAVEALPIADYHLAQLKLRQGDVDTSLDLLQRAAKVLPTEVRKRLRDEAVSWSAVAADARFNEIVESKAATPVR